MCLCTQYTHRAESREHSQLNYIIIAERITVWMIEFEYILSLLLFTKMNVGFVVVVVVVVLSLRFGFSIELFGSGLFPSVILCFIGSQSNIDENRFNFYCVHSIKSRE